VVAGKKGPSTTEAEPNGTASNYFEWPFLTGHFLPLKFAFTPLQLFVTPFANMTTPYFVRIGILLTILVTLNAAIHAQCTQKISDLPAAPELLGFHLGMTKDDVKSKVPQTVFPRADPFGVSRTTINPYFDTTIDKARFENVRSISLDLLDDRLTSLWIGFDEGFKVQATDEFVKLISQSLKIPNTWSAARGRALQLKCADFQLVVSTIAGGPSLRVVDLNAEDVIAARRQAKEEREAGNEVAPAEESRKIVGDKQSKVYYLTSCPTAREILESNKVIFKNSEEAEKAGFKLAKVCR